MYGTVIIYVNRFYFISSTSSSLIWVEEQDQRSRWGVTTFLIRQSRCLTRLWLFVDISLVIIYVYRFYFISSTSSSLIWVEEQDQRSRWGVTTFLIRQSRCLTRLWLFVDLSLVIIYVYRFYFISSTSLSLIWVEGPDQGWRWGVTTFLMLLNRCLARPWVHSPRYLVEHIAIRFIGTEKFPRISSLWEKVLWGN